MPLPCKKTHRPEPCNKKRDGFTLVELLVVLVILGLLVGIATTAAITMLGKAKSDIARIQIESFATGLDLFRIDTGRYPTSEEGLKALIQKPAGAPKWSGPYLQAREIPLDPWDRPFIYARTPQTGARYSLISLGGDGVKGGEGDNADIAAR